jgi:hypothetical protein
MEKTVNAANWKSAKTKHGGKIAMWHCTWLYIVTWLHIVTWLPITIAILNLLLVLGVLLPCMILSINDFSSSIQSLVTNESLLLASIQYFETGDGRTIESEVFFLNLKQLWKGMTHNKVIGKKRRFEIWSENIFYSTRTLAVYSVQCRYSDMGVCSCMIFLFWGWILPRKNHETWVLGLLLS